MDCIVSRPEGYLDSCAMVKESRCNGSVFPECIQSSVCISSGPVRPSISSEGCMLIDPSRMDGMKSIPSSSLLRPDTSEARTEMGEMWALSRFLVLTGDPWSGCGAFRWLCRWSRLWGDRALMSAGVRVSMS